MYVLDNPHARELLIVSKAELEAIDAETGRLEKPGHVFGPFRSARAARRFISRSVALLQFVLS